MVNNFTPFHYTQRCFYIEDSIRTNSTNLHILNPKHHSNNELPLFEMTEFTNRDVFWKKDMIGGYNNNGKGDTYI